MRIAHSRKPVARLLVLLFAGTLALIAAVLPPAANASGSARARTGSLAIRIAGLPAAVGANVTVTGPGTRKRLTRSSTLTNLRPGRYRISITKVLLPKAIHGVPAGSEVLPTTSSLSATVTAGHVARSIASYGTVINARAQVFHGHVLAVAGPAANPTALTVSATKPPKVGDVLTRAPDPTLPDGLFHVVTKVVIHGAHAILSLRAAKLAEVFPELHLHATVPLGALNEPDTSDQPHLGPPVIGVKTGAYTCATPLQDSTVSFGLGLTATADVDFNQPNFYGIPDGLPSGRAVITLGASPSVSAFLRKGLSCTASQSLFSVPFDIPVGPIPVPAFISGSVSAGLSVGSSDVTANASASASVTGGISFNGFDVSDISNSSGSGSASVSGALKLTLGPTLRIALGVKDVGDLHFDVKPGVSFTGNADASCSIDFYGNVGVGINVGPVSLNETIPGFSVNLYQCPPQPSPTPSPSGSPPPSATPVPTPASSSPEPPSPTPTPTPPAPPATSVSTDNYTSCAVIGGAVYCTGLNGNGELGDGSTTDSNVPVKVLLPAGRSAREVSVGNSYACATLDNGSVACWGGDSTNQLGDDNTSTGSSSSSNDEHTPVLAMLPAGRTAVSVSAGDGGTTCALLDNGSIACWGFNYHGDFGNGAASSGDTLQMVSLPAGRTATSVSVGFEDVCAVLDDGSAACWGANASGQIGNGTSGSDVTAPAIVSLPAGHAAVAISAGYDDACAVLADGTAYCWGANGAGQLGNGSTSGSSVPVAVSLPPTGVTGISIAESGYAPNGDYTRNHACATLADGSARCWGDGVYGTLGDGDPNETAEAATPVTVSLPAGTSVKSVISAGHGDVCAITTAESVLCWGANAYGTLGDGGGENYSSTPVFWDLD